MSTPIARIPEDPHKTLDEDQELVQSIIQEIKSQENPPPQTAPPPQAYEDDQAEDAQPNQEQYQYYEEAAPRYQREPPPPEPKRQPLVETSLWKRLWNELKEPLLVLVLYILSNLRILDKVFMRYVPRMASEIGTLNFVGVLAKGIIVTMLFFLIKKAIK